MDRTAVSGTAGTGSIPVGGAIRSENTLLGVGQVLGANAPAELAARCFSSLTELSEQREYSLSAELAEVVVDKILNKIHALFVKNLVNHKVFNNFETVLVKDLENHKKVNNLPCSFVKDLVKEQYRDWSLSQSYTNPGGYCTD